MQRKAWISEKEIMQNEYIPERRKKTNETHEITETRVSLPGTNLSANSSCTLAFHTIPFISFPSKSRMRKIVTCVLNCIAFIETASSGT